MTVGDRLLLRPAEAADMIGISRARCYKLIAEGKIPSIRIGESSIRVPVEALRHWIDSQLAATKGTAEVTDGGRR